MKYPSSIYRRATGAGEGVMVVEIYLIVTNAIDNYLPVTMKISAQQHCSFLRLHLFLLVPLALAFTGANFSFVYNSTLGYNLLLRSEIL